METDAREIQLCWRGPFLFGKSGADALPPNEPGVYAWTIPTPQGHLLSYVGESAVILSRWDEHVRMTLGGDYQIYDPELLKSGTDLVTIYGNGNLGARLLTFTREIAAAAWENLAAFELFWALLPADFPRERTWRMAVESAILSAVAPPDDRLICTRLSVRSQNAWKIRCYSTWPSGVRILGLNDCVEYGEYPPDWKAPPAALSDPH